MATCDLRISFDKEDRCYHANEPVSGKVVVEANKDFSGHDFEANLRLAHPWLGK